MVVLPWNEGDKNLKQRKRLLEYLEIKIQVMKSEDWNNQCILRFLERPHFLIQAAADPSFPNKCPATPTQQSYKFLNTRIKKCSICSFSSLRLASGVQRWCRSVKIQQSLLKYLKREVRSVKIKDPYNHFLRYPEILHILMQAAANPAFPNRQPNNPSPYRKGLYKTQNN